MSTSIGKSHILQKKKKKNNNEKKTVYRKYNLYKDENKQGRMHP